MGKVTIEIDAVEAYVTLRSMAEIMEFTKKYASHDKKFNEHYACLDTLKDNVKKSLKEQADIEDLRLGKEIIDQ